MERHTSGPHRYGTVTTTGYTGRPPTEGEAQARRRRHGPHGRPGSPQLIWAAPPRNGLPFRPYVYRGQG